MTGDNSLKKTPNGAQRDGNKQFIQGFFTWIALNGFKAYAGTQ
jgi:hypothetical protein